MIVIVITWNQFIIIIISIKNPHTRLLLYLHIVRLEQHKIGWAVRNRPTNTYGRVQSLIRCDFIHATHRIEVDAIGALFNMALPRVIIRGRKRVCMVINRTIDNHLRKKFNIDTYAHKQVNIGIQCFKGVDARVVFAFSSSFCFFFAHFLPDFPEQVRFRELTRLYRRRSGSTRIGICNFPPAQNPKKP